MVMDIEEEKGGSFHVWGVTPEGASVLVRITDFRPYFFMAAPTQQGAAAGDRLSAQALEKLQQLLNRSLPPNCRCVSIAQDAKTPIMYFRAGSPGKIDILQVTLAQGASMRKASSAVSKLLTSGALRTAGFDLKDTELYEHEVHLLQRFLVDASICGGAPANEARCGTGAWMHIPRNTSSAAAPVDDSAAGYVDSQNRISNCAVEVEASWRSLQCLTPDAIQLADPNWQAQLPQGLPGSRIVVSEPDPAAQRLADVAAGAAEGQVTALKLMTLDVLLSTSDGKDRVPVPEQDPVVAIACIVHSSRDAAAAVPVQASSAAAPVEVLEDQAGLGDEGGGGSVVGKAGAAPEMAGGVGGARPEAQGAQEQVVFLLANGAVADEGRDRVRGAVVRRFASERDLLRAWLAYVREQDPDGFVLFEARIVKETLGALQERCKAIKLDGGGLPITRLQGVHARPVTVRKVTQYSAAWVRSQSRMSSTSNQETWRAEVAGRVVFDLLRQILTNCNLASFSLVDAVQSLLGRQLEVLPPSASSALAGLSPPTPAFASVPFDREAGAVRLAAHVMDRASCVYGLLRRMATVPEIIELARATGLTLANVLYNAQMIRTWSLLLRSARRLGYMIGGRVEPAQLQESPFLMHPVEAGTVGLYRSPICVLDFASLYPSLYRAHNLCYTTLLHKDDAALLDPRDITTTPTGDQFVKPSVREGVLPSILAALIQARTSTRAALKDTADPLRRAVLDGRQKALKVTANALYGFTGAQTSMLQCLPLADSCLAMGAASTRRAVDVVHQLAADGKLGSRGESARVIYGQTDSIFVHFPDCTPAEAVGIGNQAAMLVTQAFLPEMELKYEKTLSPFMLLHVNRYAGRSFETEEDVQQQQGQLLVKGLKSTWRQAPAILRSMLGGSLRRIIMQDDVQAAVRWVEEEVHRLLSGRCELWELVMTGGLWRISGKEIASAAGGGDEEVRGPHVALAVRLSQRDPGRTFVLGQRLQYVLLPGQRLQDDASEDPLTAAKAGAVGNAELYWRNKAAAPLKELFATCLPHAALQELLTGPHTQTREDPVYAGTQAAPPSGRGGGKQTALKTFFASKVRCLGGCKRTVTTPLGAASEPALCDTCAAEEGKEALVWLELLDHLSETRQRQHLALSTCMRCHSGGMTGPIVCENGECPVMFSRLASTSRFERLLKDKERLDLSW